MNATVYAQGWTLDDVAWERFDPSKVEPWILTAVKAAALVEFNAPDYVTYLKRIFTDAPTQAAIEEWGREESQHGRALGRWAELADPEFKLDETFARFRTGYRPAHFQSETLTSVRGSRRGEMIARCVVESGTSSYYSAVRDATDEPVLKEIAGRIAADEYRHYKLFFETLNAQAEPDLPFWKKLMVAVGRINESDDDELSFAYYCATVPKGQEAARPYVRTQCAKASYATTLRIYRRRHVQKLAQMVSKAVGADPQGRVTKLAGALLWRMLRMRAGLIGVAAETAA
ncbi:MAG: ferritin-like domain-containing protein [Alphaproteobacteria bacterium]|nr:ferritin-like domain-containing protein [Alphaproteobacteria bacterium]MBV9693028.1 ferritin-like domain-containing protein [Alphaproteobacteria bacterium]